MASDSDFDGWMLAKDAAALIGITSATLSYHVRLGHIPFRRVGRQVMILRTDAEKFRDSPRKAGRPPTKSVKKRKK